jgi:peptidoglycan/xylan/chitin deacetylase (PgdA/CDA1 family)
MSTISRRRLFGEAAGLAAVAAGAAACGGLDSGAQPGTAGLGTGPQSPGAPAATAAAVPVTEGVDADLIARRYAGLKPFAKAPAPPATKPLLLSAANPTVFSKVPTSEKIVFVTIDDGLEKEPAFIQMVQDFKIPLTLFLTDAIIKDNYGYFAQLLETGHVTIQNHTITHPDMVTLSAAAQLEQVARQQTRLINEYNTTPYLFRPPYGSYNHDTIAAVKQTPDLKGIVLWKETMQITNMQYQGAHVLLEPGDIILSHFRGPRQLKGENMIEMMTNLFKHIQEQGFTVARLTDYV